MRLEIQNRPMSRGVTQLMYVGDDDAVEAAVDNGTALARDRAMKVGSAAMLAYAIFGPKKHRNAAIGASVVLAILPALGV
jgi:hypothetical protein